jgi:hypothetical protein
LPTPSKKGAGGRDDRAVLLLALSRCSPSLLLVYPPTASLGKARADGLSRDFPISAKFPSMENFKNRLTATQTPNWVAPSQESRPSSKTTPCRRGSVAPSLPTWVILAYPAHGRRHPPVASFGRAYPGNSCLPYTRQALPTRTLSFFQPSVAPSSPGPFVPTQPSLLTLHLPPSLRAVCKPAPALP